MLYYFTKLQNKMSTQTEITKLPKKYALLLYILKDKNIQLDINDILSIPSEYNEEEIHKECIQYFKNKTNKIKTNIHNVYDNPIYSIINAYIEGAEHIL